MKLSEEDKKNKKVSALISLGVHAILLLLFIFILAWKAPFPPIAEFGMEVNFGTSESGHGDTQTENLVSEELTEEDAKPEESSENLEEEKLEEEPVETEQPVEDPNIEENPVEDPTPSTVSTPEESPVVATTAKAEEKPKVEKKEKVEEKAMMGAKGNKGTANETPGNNQGNTDKTGDQGDPQGSLDSKSLMGKPGKGGNFLEMTGWQWADEPTFNDKSQYSGKIIFQIKIDGSGEIISVVAVEKSVPQAVVDVYKREIEKGAFIPTRDNNNPAPASIGKYTVIIKAK